MYRSIVYCLFVVSTLGVASVRHVLSLPHDDVIDADRSTAARNSYDNDDTGNDVNNDDALDEDTGSRSSPPGGGMMKRVATPVAGKGKFLFGRSSWPSLAEPLHHVIGSSSSSSRAVGGSSRAAAAADYSSKRHDSRRQFKFGKKSFDGDEDDDVIESLQSTVDKRKMIKFGRR